MSRVGVLPLPTWPVSMHWAWDSLPLSGWAGLGLAWLATYNSKFEWPGQLKCRSGASLHELWERILLCQRDCCLWVGQWSGVECLESILWHQSEIHIPHSGRSVRTPQDAGAKAAGGPLLLLSTIHGYELELTLGDWLRCGPLHRLVTRRAWHQRWWRTYAPPPFPPDLTLAKAQSFS